MYVRFIFILIYILEELLQFSVGQEALPAYVTHDYCVPNGVRQTNVATFRDCFLTCHDRKSCLAFEYVEADKTCYFHGFSSACDMKVASSGCIHFGLVQCGQEYDDGNAEPATKTTKEPTTPQTRTPTTTTTTTTTTSQAPRSAVETTTGPSSESEDVVISGLAGTTSGPTTPPSTTTSSTTTALAVTEPPLDISAYILKIYGLHIKNGFLLRKGIREQECLDVCANHPLCLAVDYFSTDGGCYAHSTNTYCGDLTRLDGNTHYKRVPCVGAASRDVAQEIYRGMYSYGGNELCSEGCSVETCLSACYLEEECLGLSINTTSGACFSHRDSAVCDITRIDNDIVQINIGQCFTDNCLSQPCDYGGTCIEELGGYTCRCPPGFKGTNCQINIDDCAYNPCYNGGKCIDQRNGFYCHCRKGFTGETCKIDINECTSSPCHNGGECVDGAGGYLCVCAPGFSGVYCQTNINECYGITCENGGTCVDGVNSFNCLCPMGYGGDTCNKKLATCWKDTRYVTSSNDLVIIDRSSPVEECNGLCYARETIKRFGPPKVERGCQQYSVTRQLQTGCVMENQRKTITCYCSTRRCNGLSIDAMTSLILHLPLNGDLVDHSGLSNHAETVPRSNSILYNCTDASTDCSVQVDGSQCLVIPSLSGYAFGHPDPFDMSIFLPRLTAVVAFKKSQHRLGIQGIIGTQDFVNEDREPRFQIIQGYPTHDYISAGLHASKDLTEDLHDYIAEVKDNRWYLATLTYDGYYKKPTKTGDIPYSQSTVLYLNGMKTRGNSRVNIGNITMNNQPVTVGCAGGNYFSGMIDEVRLFNDVISPHDRRALLAMRD